MDVLDDALRVIESLNAAILTRLGEATHFSDLEYEEKDIAGVKVRVATPMTLFRMKRNTVRAVDHADAIALRDAFHLLDEK